MRHYSWRLLSATLRVVDSQSAPGNAPEIACIATHDPFVTAAANAPREPIPVR